MSWMRNIAVGLLLIFVFQSCFNPPEFPAEPEIEYSSIQFKDVATAGVADSLIIRIKFQDGDGNLGLSDADRENIAFADKLYFDVVDRRFTNRFVDGRMLTYKIKRTLDRDGIASNDTLPNFVTPYNCSTWEVRTFNRNNVSVRDTLWIKLNPNHYNIFVSFFVKNNDGSFTEFDPLKTFIYPNCVVNLFNGRFPILAKNPNQESPLEGVIRYSMPSEAFNLFFSIKTLKLKIRIQDRALNKSNEIETPEFTLQSIR